ncbi:hypothetical protein [Methylobacterium nonmethylotrophicum]|uniref:Glycosyltransferase RgtA/B/C/D-like domain-containing protein n=1 Tax=Methylobacterium nonmethylotrophicum TaxID=1141884 RepID=A0A4Z0NE36_9HYPH|nr:hypothetical protein [Methylobacterium nonmethylotrophicum]TGD94251.1 hypothetical protein EU555_32475 [Methylobacterium nonmethylotrophicum]
MLAAPLPQARSGEAAGRSPFERPALVWLIVAAGLAGVLSWPDLGAVLRALRLPDTDDAMRLLQVRDLLAGQPWFDLAQHRHAGAPPMHWSRLVDAPIAALVILARPVLGAALAEGAAAILWPLLLFCLYAVILYRGVRRAFGWRAGALAVFAGTQAVFVTGLFAPGRIDHHNVQICAVLGLALLVARPAPTGRDGALAGALAALSLAVGLEALPVIAAAGLVLAATWLREGRPALPAFLGFGLALGFVAPALYVAQTAPALWSTSACDALSPPWLWLCAAAAVTAAAAALLRGGPGARLGLLAAGGLATAGGFLALFPACAAGPFTAMPDLVREGWLLQVREMRPVWQVARMAPEAVLAGYLPVLLGAAAASLWALRGPESAERRLMGIAAGVLWLGLALGAVQFRGLYVAGAFVPLVAGPVFDRAVALLRAPEASPRRRLGALALSLALCGKVWLLAAALPQALAGTDKTLEADHAAWQGCGAKQAVAALDVLPPGLILAEIDLGPNLLLHSHHAVVAAPYHRALPGLSAALEAFQEAAALPRVAARVGADYIVACAAPAKPDEVPTFAARLGRGEVAPPGLEPVPVQGTPLRVWRLRPAP